MSMNTPGFDLDSIPFSGSPYGMAFDMQTPKGPDSGRISRNQIDSGQINNPNQIEEENRFLF
jgi:hypothetical protein